MEVCRARRASPAAGARSRVSARAPGGISSNAAAAIPIARRNAGTAGVAGVPTLPGLMSQGHLEGRAMALIDVVVAAGAAEAVSLLLVLWAMAIRAKPGSFTVGRLAEPSRPEVRKAA